MLRHLLIFGVEDEVVLNYTVNETATQIVHTVQRHTRCVFGCRRGVRDGLEWDDQNTTALIIVLFILITTVLFLVVCTCRNRTETISTQHHDAYTITAITQRIEAAKAFIEKRQQQIEDALVYSVSLFGF